MFILYSLLIVHFFFVSFNFKGEIFPFVLWSPTHIPAKTMPFPFGKSQKSPAEIVKSLKENVAYLEKLESPESRKCEKVSAFYFFLLKSRCKCFSTLWSVIESEKLTVFPVGCRGSIKKSCIVERGAVWHWRQGASDWGSGPTSSRALQHQPPHFTDSKSTEDWFWGAYHSVWNVWITTTSVLLEDILLCALTTHLLFALFDL